MEPQIQYTKTADGVTIAYYAIGQGPPFVMMALPSHLQAERKLSSRVFEEISRMATLVRYDHRGFGLSERDVSAFPLDALVSDLEAVVDRLGLTRFVLSSWGGYSAPIAMSYAAAHPERVSRLVLNNAFARIPPQFHQQVQGLLLSTNDWRFASESVVRLLTGWEDEEQSRMIAASIREASTFDTFRAFWRDAGQWDVRDLLPNVVMPTLVLNMADNPVAGPEQSREIASLMPDARATIAEGLTYAERGPKYNSAIASFLLGPDAARPGRDVGGDVVRGPGTEETQRGLRASAAVRGAGERSISPSLQGRGRGSGRMEPRIQYAKAADGVSIAFWTLGEGMPLVHAPLVPFGHMQLEWEMEEVRRWYESLAQERMLVGYDRRGTGLSDRDVVDYSLDAQVLDLEAIVKRLGVTQFALFAGLYLGPAGIAYAARHRDKVTHLLLWCTGPRAPEGLLDARYELLDPLIETDWKRYTETRVHWAVGWENPELARKYAALLREGSTPESMRAYQRASSEFDASALLKEVQSPTLVLHMRSGARSALNAARQLASQIPDARLAAVEGSAPYPWMGRQEPALTAIDEFLGEAEEEAAGRPYSGAATARMPAAALPAFAGGRYTVTRLLGEGAQKTVYLVHDAALERECALAVVKTEMVDENDLARLEREGRAMARLTHPNIVAVHDIGEEGGRPYLVCEYVPGGDLRDELSRASGPLPIKRALAIAADVCAALAFAHAQGIVHRDVKPGNVHMTKDGSAKLGDFGLALAADRSRLTMAGTAMGTAAYMAPEQARRQPVDARSDLYSLGCLLYELISGRPPFAGDDPMSVVSQHVHALPAPPSIHNAKVPRELEQLVLGLLAKTKENRPSSAGEVLAELRRIAAVS